MIASIPGFELIPPRSSQMAVVYLDLDGFKQINDTHGHGAGDKVLQHVSAHILESVRRTDMVARLGGDEFVIVLPGVGELTEARRIADLVAAAIARPLAYGGHELRIGASFGISVYPADGDNTDALLKIADEDMYRAKLEAPQTPGVGRQRVQRRRLCRVAGPAGCNSAIMSLLGDNRILRPPLARLPRLCVPQRRRGSMESNPRVAPKNESDKVNILLVDDQRAKLLSYEAILAGMGETLIKASSACEAFECLLKNEVALILIDVCMPDLDGFELAALIRDHPRFQRTGIIFVSAVLTANLDQLRGYELGAFDYVPVPVVPEILRARVKVFVDLYRKTRQFERLNAELEQQVVERTITLRRLNEQLERRIAERTREREKALAQLFEAQKMDTVGELTGEVAHDFNNLLMAVLGSLTLLGQRLPEDPQCRRLLDIA